MCTPLSWRQGIVRAQAVDTHTMFDAALHTPEMICVQLVVGVEAQTCAVLSCVLPVMDVTVSTGADVLISATRGVCVRGRGERVGGGEKERETPCL